MKNTKKYHIVTLVLKSNRKIWKEVTWIYLTHMYMTDHFPGLVQAQYMTDYFPGLVQARQ